MQDAGRHAVRSSNERGAALILIAVMVLVLVVSGALAVDISSLQREGQQLQNAADAAALAGARAWSATGDVDATTAAVDDLLTQNGYPPAAVETTIDFSGLDQVSVNLVDEGPSTYLGGVVGLGGSIERDATAVFTLCDADCYVEVDLPRPLEPVHVVGTGDGFVPVAVGNKLYGVNHHSSTISCVDRLLLEQCWTSRELFQGTKNTTDNHFAAAVDHLIYYLGRGGSEAVLACWNTITDTRCPTEISLGDQRHANMYLAPDNRIFAITQTRKIFCFVAITHEPCAGYDGGLDVATAAVPGWVESNYSVWKAHRVAHNGKLYHSMTSRGQVFLHCWDTNLDQQCAGFGVHLLNDSRLDSYDWAVSGRLFLNRDSAGTPTNLCSLSQRNVECRDFDTGAVLPGEEAAFDALHKNMTFSGWSQLNSYHAPSNRLFTVNSEKSWTYCHDFTTSSYCGSIHNTSPVYGVIETYGYIADGDCLIGLGDESIFFSIKPDLSGPCDASNVTVDLSPCLCSGDPVWAEISVVNSDDLATVGVRVLDNAGELLLPDDGTAWLDGLAGSVDLSVIDTNLASITIEIAATAKSGRQPWASGAVQPQLSLYTPEAGPRLVE